MSHGFSIHRTIARMARGINSLVGINERVFLKLMFRGYTGRKLELHNPILFNDKIQWLKLNYRKQELTELTDKISVKKWVADRIGSEYIIPTLAVWDSPDDIDTDTLPDSFVLKCNHSGGAKGVFVVIDKRDFNIEEAASQLKHRMRRSLYRYFGEWAYKDIKPRILAEKLIGNDIDDYKFHCFNGKVDSVMVCHGRKTGNTRFFFLDPDWKLLRYNESSLGLPDDFSIPKPKNVEKMFEIASALSEGFPFVRVDLYNVEGKIYFGEMTFYPRSGYDTNLLPETEVHFGSLLHLPHPQSAL